MGGWKDYISYMTNENVTEHAHIFGHDGSVWASSTGLAALKASDIDIPDANNPDKTVKHHCDEKKNLLEAVGNKGVTKDAAGVRINGEKYQTVRFDADTKTWYLKKNKGGACICVTNQTILFGSWHSDLKTTAGVPQGAGSCNARVEALAKLLRDANY
jgi:profilin